MAYPHDPGDPALISHCSGWNLPWHWHQDTDREETPPRLNQLWPPHNLSSTYRLPRPPRLRFVSSIMSQVSPRSLVPVQHEAGRTSISVASTMPKSFKRRASKACSFCQWRKIRCNVEERHPCSNCILEGIECSITKTRKTKYIESHSPTDQRKC